MADVAVVTASPITSELPPSLEALWPGIPRAKVDPAALLVEVLRRRARRASARCTDAALGGLALLMVTGVIVTATLPLQRPERDHWLAISVVVVSMWVLKPLLFLLPWRSWPAPAALVLPVAAMLGLTALAAVAPGLAGAYVGVYVLAFVYTGLFLPARSAWWLLVPAALTYGPVAGGWSRPVGVRLLIVAIVWVVVAELLAHLVAAQRATVSALDALSRRDALTRLDNRRGLATRLQQVNIGDVVVMADLDHFKAVNDTHGHARGDQVLADFARLLHAELRGQDYAARYGGEEFVLVLPRTTASAAGEVLHRLHQRWAASSPVTTFSAGYTVHSDQPGGIDQTLREADEALYAAKTAGRDRDHIHHPTPPPAPRTSTACRPHDDQQREQATSTS